ncbi:unnamed protein product [Anisakis simplex]|uniref:Transposase n=1 Tax=Anisakis simplex TaxID=6269 RepID=A0A0M3JIA7_ANISI|nr:unnamed protein product [Anisakis simplex]
MSKVKTRGTPKLFVRNRTIYSTIRSEAKGDHKTDEMLIIVDYLEQSMIARDNQKSRLKYG